MEAQHHKPKILKSYINNRRQIHRERERDDDEGKTEFLQVKKKGILSMKENLKRGH